MPIQYDESRAPLVVVTSLAATNDTDFESYLTKMSATLARQPRFGVILDAREAERPTPKQRQRQAEWIKSNAAALKQRSVGMSFVIDKAIIRGSLTAILWLQPLPMPHSVFATYEESEAWLGERLKTVGLQIPARNAVG